MLIMKFRGQGDFHPGIVNGDFYVIAEDEDRLPTRVDQVEETQRLAVPAATWTFSFPNPPIEVYFTMNKTQLVNLLQSNMQGIFENMSFGSQPNDGVMTATRIKAAGNSPRSNFPDDLGTDGQRLRRGDSKTAGAALNYIGKLFFLTSNAAFFAIFQNLKAGKITVKQALTAAESIVQA